MDCIYPAQDEDQWRTLMNTVKKLRVLSVCNDGVY
jgi:hypothetical protein